MTRGEGRGAGGEGLPLALLLGFAVFLVVMGYLVASSLTRRTAPTFAPSVAGRVRAAGWERGGDTLTVDATDAERWRYVSLGQGRVLVAPDTAEWDIAVRRYHLMMAGSVADLGAVDFDAVRVAPGRVMANGVPSDGREAKAPADRWYRYGLLTHLLESNRSVYVVRAAGGEYYKVQVLSYYCPGLTAGCMTVRYAPLAPDPRAAQAPRTGSP